MLKRRLIIEKNVTRPTGSFTLSELCIFVTIRNYLVNHVNKKRVVDITSQLHREVSHLMVISHRNVVNLHHLLIFNRTRFVPNYFCSRRFMAQAQPSWYTILDLQISPEPPKSVKFGQKLLHLTP